MIPKRILTLLTLTLLFIITGPFVRGDIIPADRRTTWQNNAGVQGGIPNVTTVYRTLTTANTLADVNSAIAACPSNQVVQLAAGTYNFAGSIHISSKKGVVLRGAGPTTTIINFTGGSKLHGNIDFTGAGSDVVNPPSTVSITGGLTDGSTTLTLSSTAGLQNGWVMGLDELCSGPDFDHTGIQGCSECSRSGGTRGIAQYVKVTSISGNSVTIDPPIFGTNWSDSLSPQAWWWGNSSEMCGVEDLQVNFAGTADETRGISFMCTFNCWMKNIRSYYGVNSHVCFYRSSRGEVRHSYFYGTRNSATQSYGVNILEAGNCLTEDCIFDSVVGSIVLEAGSGNILAFNYTTNTYFAPDPSWMIHCLSTHGGHCSYNLFEGNYGGGYSGDFIHGSGGHNTFYRNALIGWEAGKTAGTTPIQLQATNHNNNIVGNVLGKPGFHTTYSGMSNFRAIYDLGCRDPATGCNPTDPIVAATLLRHGNYDFASHSIVWDPNIPDHTLPPSYYLANKPAYFGILPWPAFDPANPALESVTSIPAGYRYVFGVDPPGSGNQPPVAAASASPTNGVAPLTVSFSSAGSSDPEGLPLTYAWTFGDGAGSTAANPSHTYSTAGSYTASLTVSDGLNSTTSAGLHITVTASGLRLLPPAVVSGGMRISFTGSPAVTYQVQRATNVVGPWTLAANVTAGSNGVGVWTDTAAPAARAFYRVKAP